MKVRNKQIEFLRTILFLMIVNYHYTYRFNQLFDIKTINFLSLSSWGDIGIVGFFMISGYFIFSKKDRNIRPLKFLTKRLLKLYPVYLLCISLTFLSMNFFGLPGREVNFFEYFCNVTLLNGYIGIDYVDGAHWYLTYLVLFNFTVFFIILLENKFKIDQKKALIGWAILNLLLFAISNFVPGTLILYKLLGNKYFYYLLIGISLKEISSRKINSQNFIYIFLYCLSFAIVATIDKLIVCVAILIFSFVLIIPELKILKSHNLEPILKLGSISYIGYLIHQNIGYQILLGLTDYFGKYSIAFVPFTMLIIIGLSAIIYKYFDLPLQKIIIKRINND